MGFMTRRSSTELWALCLVSLLAPATAGASYAGSPAEKAAAKKGAKLVREISLDLDGDGKNEIGAVEQVGGEMRVVVLQPTGSEEEEGGYRRVAESSRRAAKRVLRLEAQRLVGRAAPELLAIFEDPSPDETSLSVRIMSGTGRGIVEIFAHTFFLPAQTQRDGKVVSFGDASPHYTVEDVENGDGDKEIIWVKEPNTLTLPGKDGPVTFVIGAVRTVFRYDEGKGRYEMAEKDQVVDFLPELPVSDVEASAQVAKIWGTAQAFWATDGDLATSWNVSSKGAVGQTLTAKLKGGGAVRMIRLVPGCGNSIEEWNRFDRVQGLRITLGSGQRFELDRRRLDPLPAGVKAVGEFPLEEGFGAQLLIFLDEPQELPWARLEITKVEKAQVPKKQAANEVCVSELSFH